MRSYEEAIRWVVAMSPDAAPRGLIAYVFRMDPAQVLADYTRAKKTWARMPSTEREDLYDCLGYR